MYKNEHCTSRVCFSEWVNEKHIVKRLVEAEMKWKRCYVSADDLQYAWKAIYLI